MARVLIAYSPTRLGKDRAGKPCIETHILSTVEQVEAALVEKGHRVERAALQRDVTRFLGRARRFRPHVVFNLCEQVGGDARLEKNAVAIFELARLPFTGNGCLALALCLEKAMAKRILKVWRLATPEFVVVAPGEEVGEFPMPAIVKPSRADGSLGITARSVVKSAQKLAARVQYVHRRFHQPALVERFIAGREFQVALLGNGDPRVLAVAELSYAGLPKNMPRIVSYSAKWRPVSSYYRHTNAMLPAKVSPKLRRRLEQAALSAFHLLGLRGYARVDFRMGRSGGPQIIEVNPNPDISPDAGLCRAAAHAGLSYADLIDRIVELALEQP
jgi:D-alanine-D-alanine ligase